MPDNYCSLKILATSDTYFNNYLNKYGEVIEKYKPDVTALAGDYDEGKISSKLFIIIANLK